MTLAHPRLTFLGHLDLSLALHTKFEGFEVVPQAEPIDKERARLRNVRSCVVEPVLRTVTGLTQVLDSPFGHPTPFGMPGSGLRRSRTIFNETNG